MVMLCKSITEAELLKGDWQQYISEAKLDGTRCMLIKSNDKINLMSRSNNDYTHLYPKIVEEAKYLQDCVLDGELTFYNNDGKDIFLTSLATAETIKEYGVKAKLMIFDILEWNGVDVKKEPLMKRKEYLKGIINPYWKEIKLLGWYNDAIKLWTLVKEQDTEGIIIKHKQSLYTPNFRSKYWLKIKNFKEAIMEFDDFEYMSNAEKGITLTNKEGYRIACLGSQSLKVLNILEKEGKVKCRIQFLQITKDSRYRFISYRGLE